MSRRRALDEFLARVRHLPRQGLLDTAALDLLDAFRAVGVEPLLLKGPALARTLYQPGEHRGYGDVDLLVARHDLPSARRALVELGYRNVSEGRGIDDVAGVLHSEDWSRPVENKRLPPVMVDLHWRLAGCEAPAEVTWRVLGARRAWIELEGRAAPVLASDGLALHLATHAAQHGPNDLKAIADLTRGIGRWNAEVWRAAAQLADQVDGTAAFAAGLRLTPTGAELARELGLPPTDELEWAIINRRVRPRGTFHLQALIGARGARERLGLLRRALLPGREWIRWQYPWAADSGTRLIAAYAAHVLRAPLWAARAWHYLRRKRGAGS